jgi:ABC-type transport system involved in multi-copper enzyme maturation permease subunit
MRASLQSWRHLDNPVLTKDLITRMRGAKAFVIQGIYVGILTAMMGIAYLTWWLSHQFTGATMAMSSDLGRMLYMLIFETQAALVVLITPALTAGAITVEHEQRTYELLACSRISPRAVINGKLLSGWLFSVMLLTCSLPLAALCLMFGGISAGEIFWSYIMLCLFALLFSSIGVFFSASLRRSTAAVLLTYGTVFAYLLLTFLGQLIANQHTGNDLGTISVFNPFVFINASTDTIKFFGADVPGWLPGLVLLPLASLFLLNWSMQKLPNYVVNRALAMRILLALLWFAVTILAVADAAGPETFEGTAIVAAVLLIVLGCLFTTGEMEKEQPRSLFVWLLSGLDPRKVFSNRLGGGWAYLLLLTLLFSAALPIGLFFGNALPGLGYSAAPRPVAHALTFPENLALSGQVFAILASGILLYGALGAIGAAVRSRALGIWLIVLTIVLWIIPLMMMIQYDSARTYGNTGESPAYYLVYLAPFFGLILIFEPASIKDFPAILHSTALPVWLVTTVIFLVLALIVMVIAEITYQAKRYEAPPVGFSEPEPQTGG